MAGNEGKTCPIVTISQLFEKRKSSIEKNY